MSTRSVRKPPSPHMSAEVFVIPVGQAYLVYAPLRRAAFLTSAEVVNLIADLQEGDLDVCRSDLAELLDFLRRLDIVDGDEEVLPITTYQGNPKPTTVTLFLTTRCNLRCTYCYASAGDTPDRAMSLQVARQGIDFVIGKAKELGESHIEIAYHGGGEPTTNWQTLTESFAYAQEQAGAAGLGVRAGMATNGVLTDDKIDWIIAHLNGASVSYDGLPDVHDANRINLVGGGSSSKVLHTIRRFEAARFHYGLRLTVTHGFLGKMEESIRFICERFHPDRIQVEPAYQLGRWREAPSAETQAFIDGFRAAQITARQYGQEIHFSAARVGLLSNHFCGISQDNFCPTADGNVSACYETFLEENPLASTFFYGDFDPGTQGFRFQLPVLDNLRRQSVEHHAFCEGCFARWSCGGDCYHKSLTVNGTSEFAGSDRCHIIRELTKDQILTRIADAGGLFWHEEGTDHSQAQGKEVLL